MKLPLLPTTGAALKLTQADGVIGGRIWPAATALCEFVAEHFSSSRNIRHCVELGSGTGVVGIYAAAVLGCRMTLTEHRPSRLSVISSLPYAVDGTPEFWREDYQDERSDRLLQLLERNVHQNRHLFENDEKTPQVAELDWTEASHAQQVVASQTQGAGFDLVLASDVTYVSQLHQPLADTIAALLLRDEPCSGDGGDTNSNQAEPLQQQRQSSTTTTLVRPTCLVSHQQRVLNLRGQDFQLIEFERSLLQAGLTTVNIQSHPVTEGSTTHKVSILEIQHQDGSSANSDNGSSLWLP